MKDYGTFYYYFNHLIDNKILSFIDSFLDNNFDYKELAKNIFGFESKLAVKYCIKIMDFDYDGIEAYDYVLIKKISVLSKSLNLNKDIIFSELEKYFNNKSELDTSFTTRFLTVDSVKKLLDIYNERRVIQLIIHGKMDHYFDITDMIKTVIEKERSFDFLPKKPKSLDQIHKYLQRYIPKIDIENFDLKQREDILKLDNQKIDDDMIIRVPKSHYDLVDLGEDLSFCIGNGTYSRQVRNQQCSIVGIYNKKGALYGVQFTRYTIKSAYGFDNEVIPADILAKLHNALTSAPELPDDFLPIEKSWIKGYKYNNKDLYLMMQDKVYIYFDVPQDVYEELLASESKGRYVNKIIKGAYQYERLA